MLIKPQGLRKGLFYCFVFTAVISAVWLARYAYDGVEHKRLENEISAMADSAIAPGVNESGKAAGTSASGVRKGYLAELSALNPDFLGMITIPGLAGFNEPFVQGDDNKKYLTVDFKGRSSNYGTIYIDAANAPDFTDPNTVFYGHNMRDNSMFGRLLRYNSQEGYREAPVIEIDSLSGRSVWLVFAAYTCLPDWGYTATKLTGKEFAALLQEIKARSVISTGVDVSRNDRIITLSTCSYDFKDARFAVHARLLRAGESVPGE